MASEKLTVAQLQLMERGTTAEVYQVPTGEALKVFPLHWQEPTVLLAENRLEELLEALEEIKVPLVPNTEVIGIRYRGYYPKAVRMQKIPEGSYRSVGTDVIANVEKTCMRCSEIIGILHASGIVIDPLEKVGISSHQQPQLYAIFYYVSGEVTVFDWTNLSLVRWLVSRSQSPVGAWVKQIEDDLTGLNCFNPLFAGRRLNLEYYQKTFIELCPNEKVRVAHQRMIERNKGIRL